MSGVISRFRERYKPEKIKLLFIAESPPKSSESRFFYNHKQEARDYLYHAVMEVVFKDFKHIPGEKDNWLRKFQKKGYYLILQR